MGGDGEGRANVNRGSTLSGEEIAACVWRLSLDGAVLESNARVAALLPDLAAPGTLLSQSFAAEDQARFTAALAAARREPVERLVLATAGPSEAVRRRLQWSLTFSPTTESVVALAVDVDELVSRSRYFEQMLDAIPDFVLIKGAGSRLHWANRAFRDYYGMSNEELRELIDAPFNEPDYTKQYVLDDEWVWSHKQTLVIECEPVTRFDGVVRRVQTIKSPILDDQGEVVFTVGISRDINDRLVAEENAAQSAKMASLGEMAGGIAHEINNPMSVVLSKTRQLKRALDQGALENETLERALEVIERSGDRVTKIVNGLRRFSRDSSSDPFERVPLSSIVDDALSLCGSRFRNAGIDLRVPVVPPDLMLSCRPGLIAQVLLNLLGNAYDAVVGSAEPGEATSWVELRVDVTGERVELRVLDSGPGVSPQIETKVMQPFFTTKPAGKGTGLGLSVSSAIAHDHGGSLHLDRATSASCFLLTLKRARPA